VDYTVRCAPYGSISTRAPQYYGTAIAVQALCLMLDLKIIILQCLDPSGQLTLGLLEVEQPAQGIVIRPQED